WSEKRETARAPPPRQGHRPAPRRDQLPHPRVGRPRPRLPRLARPDHDRRRPAPAAGPAPVPAPTPPPSGAHAQSPPLSPMIPPKLSEPPPNLTMKPEPRPPIYTGFRTPPENSPGSSVNRPQPLKFGSAKIGRAP